MLKRRILAVILIGLWGREGLADKGVQVHGCSTRFATSIQSRVGDKPVRMVLTGTAMRTKWTFNVYALGSYLQEGVVVRNAEGLARASVAKQLHLVFVRDVDGETMSESFQAAIRLNYPAPAFAPELERLTAFFRAHPVQEGDQIWLTSIPGVGLGVQVVGKTGLLIENVRFAQAAWEAYLGRSNLGVAIKEGLSSRL
jgi:hypothetical protein